MENSIDYRNLLLWLADCEAATTEHLKYLKSSSKSELRRHRAICQDLASALSGNAHNIMARKADVVLQRLNDALKD